MPRQKAKRRTAAYRMPPPNDDIFDYGASLLFVRHPGKDGRTPSGRFWSFRCAPLGAEWPWMEPRLFEQMLASDKIVQRLARKLAANKNAAEHPAFKKLRRRITELFETSYLAAVLNEFDNAVDLIAQFVVARAAHEASPGSDSGTEGSQTGGE